VGGGGRDLVGMAIGPRILRPSRALTQEAGLGPTKPSEGVAVSLTKGSTKRHLDAHAVLESIPRRRVVDAPGKPGCDAARRQALRRSDPNASLPEEFALKSKTPELALRGRLSQLED
jgi:hypothetical protein